MGSGLVLNVAQVRYCLAEDIRIAAAEELVNNADESEVDRFNVMVTDYNSRCSSFKYRSGTLESARKEVERFQGDLRAEGRGRLKQDVARRSSKAATPQRGALRDSVAPVLASTDASLPSTQFADTDARLAYLRWLGAASSNLPAISDPASRRAFLETVWYESRRAGLEPSLVLGLIQVSSGFRKYAISESGARGYMQVASGWASEIGDGDSARLFHLQPNLRFGCVLLRHYQDLAKGNTRAALRSYFGQANGQMAAAPGASPEKFVQSVLKATSAWATTVADPEGAATSAAAPPSQLRSRSDIEGTHAPLAGQVGPKAPRTEPPHGQAVQRPDGPTVHIPQARPASLASGETGRYDLSAATTAEQAAIERACETTRSVSGPSAHHACLDRELSSLRASGGRPDLSVIGGAERTAIERACETTQSIAGPGAYYGCLRREVSSLKSSGGRPDLSIASEAERAAIERACETTQSISGPGAYYGCLRREMSSLKSSGGRPDLSLASAAERVAIERACETTQSISGPGAYYGCLGREMSSLKSSGGRPDLSIAREPERKAIEKACETTQSISGPGAYYQCLARELSSLRSSGGRPNMSRVTTSQQLAIERACETTQSISGPGSYYGCLRRELSQLGY